MPSPVFVYTTHALDTFALRELEQTWIERTVLKPEATEPDPDHPERTRAYRVVPERGGRILRVVYVRDGDTVRIVTAFLDRGRRRVSRAGQV